MPEKLNGRSYIGIDVGRKNDLTVIVEGRYQGNTLYVSDVVELKDVPFAKQFQIIADYARRADKVCIDSTGIGMQLSEDLFHAFGSWKVEPVTFTNSSKSEMAFALKRRFEEKTIRIPNAKQLRQDLHGVRRITTTAGNTRFDAEHTSDGHSDRFWALALMVKAVGNTNGNQEFYIPMR
jgi:phage FluMu gp28-like protein